MWEGNKNRKRLVIAAVLLAVFLSLKPAEATSVQLVISEIMWDGTEYIEFFNPTEEEINLNDWQLTRQQAGGEVKTIVTFTAADTIGAQEYFLMEKNEAATELSADKLSSSLTLVNTGELVTLLDAEGNVVDQANQLGAWFAGENTMVGVAMERSDWSALGTMESAWHTSTGSLGGRLGTPGQENSEPHQNTAPIAVLSGPDQALVGAEILFTAEDSSDLDGDELTFSWNLGDGTSSTEESVHHTYTSPGQIVVIVTVSDEEAETEASHELTIIEPTYSDDIAISEFLVNPAGSDTAGGVY